MTELKRYNLAKDYGYDDGECFSLMEDEPSPNGEWYKAAEVDAAIDQLQAIIDELRSFVEEIAEHSRGNINFRARELLRGNDDD